MLEQLQKLSKIRQIVCTYYGITDTLNGNNVCVLRENARRKSVYLYYLLGGTMTKTSIQVCFQTTDQEFIIYSKEILDTLMVDNKELKQEIDLLIKIYLKNIVY